MLNSCEKSTVNSLLSSGSTYQSSIPLPERRINDLAYGTHPLQTLDIILPEGRGKATKLMVLIHGGQWTLGDKSNMEIYITALKPHLPDFAFASINYQLVDGRGRFLPVLEKDVINALSFLWSMTDSFNISDKTVLLGESAGGQLALLNAYKLNVSKIKAVIGIKSPANLTKWYENASNPWVRPMLEQVTGGTPVTQPQIYFNSSPVNFITPSDPATLILHGDFDSFVPADQAILLSSKLNNCGVKQQINLFPGESHTFSGNVQQEMYDLIRIFLSDNKLYR